MRYRRARSNRLAIDSEQALQTYIEKPAQGINFLSLELEKSKNLAFFKALNSAFNDKRNFLTKDQLFCKQIHTVRINLSNSRVGEDETDYKELGKNLQNFQHLRALELNLDWNALRDSAMRSIGLGIGNMEKLQSLSLSFWGNEFLDLGVTALAQAISHSGKRNNITVSSLFNYDDDYSVLITDVEREQTQQMLIFEQLTQLSINFSYTSITEMGVKSLMKSIEGIGAQLTHLNLNLSNNAINSNCMSEVSDQLSRFTNLRELSLNLKENRINAKGACQLAPAFTKLRFLKSFKLNLCSNSVGELGVIELSKAFGASFFELQELSLNFWGNNIQERGVEAVNECLQRICPSLTKLKLNFGSNNLWDNPLIALFNLLEKRAKKLTSFCLHLGNNFASQQTRNSMSSAGAISLASLLQALSQQLTRLDINVFWNRIEDQGAEALFKVIVAMPLIRQLQVNVKWNRISLDTANATVETCRSILSLQSAKLEYGFTGMKSLKQLSELLTRRSTAKKNAIYQYLAIRQQPVLSKMRHELIAEILLDMFCK